MSRTLRVALLCGEEEKKREKRKNDDDDDDDDDDDNYCVYRENYVISQPSFAT